MHVLNKPQRYVVRWLPGKQYVGPLSVFGGGHRRVAFTRTATVSTATGWVRVGSQMSRTRTAPSLSKELYPTYRGSMNTVPQLPVHKSGKLASY